MGLWKFEIIAWSPDVGEYRHKGLIWGKNFTDAVYALEEWYGDELCELTVEPCGEAGQPYLFDE